MVHNNNLIEMSLRLNRSEPLFRTIRELPGIGKRPRTKDNIRLQRNLHISFMVVRQKPTQTFILRVLLAKNLDLESYSMRRPPGPTLILCDQRVSSRHNLVFDKTKQNKTNRQ